MRSILVSATALLLFALGNAAPAAEVDALEHDAVESDLEPRAGRFKYYTMPTSNLKNMFLIRKYLCGNK